MSSFPVCIMSTASSSSATPASVEEVFAGYMAAMQHDNETKEVIEDSIEIHA